MKSKMPEFVLGNDQELVEELGHPKGSDASGWKQLNVDAVTFLVLTSILQNVLRELSHAVPEAVWNRVPEVIPVFGIPHHVKELGVHRMLSSFSNCTFDVQKQGKQYTAEITHVPIPKFHGLCFNFTPEQILSGSLMVRNVIRHELFHLLTEDAACYQAFGEALAEGLDHHYRVQDTVDPPIRSIPWSIDAAEHSAGFRPEDYCELKWLDHHATTAQQIAAIGAFRGVEEKSIWELVETIGGQQRLQDYRLQSQQVDKGIQDIFKSDASRILRNPVFLDAKEGVQSFLYPARENEAYCYTLQFHPNAAFKTYNPTEVIWHNEQFGVVSQPGTYDVTRKINETSLPAKCLHNVAAAGHFSLEHPTMQGATKATITGASSSVELKKVS